MKKLFTKLTLLFIVLALSPAIQSQMILEYNLELSSGTTITLPLYGTVNVTVDWGDGNTEPYTTTGNKNHTYATGGTKAVSISGSLTQFGSGVAYNNADKLVRVTSFGNLGLTSLYGAFYGTTNLEEVPVTLPGTITELYSTFYSTGKASITGLDSWDVSNVTTMRNMFLYTTAFNQDISSWDVSSVTNMRSMFNGATSFNQPLNSWNVSNVTNMSSMFDYAKSFNQPLNNWNVSSVTNMGGMFYEAWSFNQDISNWNVSNVTNMYGNAGILDKNPL